MIRAVHAGGWDLAAPYTIGLRVAHEDVDVLGHTNNTSYIRWCELVSWAHAEALGVGLETYRRLRRAMVITRCEFRYHAPSLEHDEVEVATWIVACDGHVSVTRRYQVRRVSDAVTLVRGRTQFVCVDMDSGRARRMPELFATAYTNAVVDEPPP